MFVRKQKKAAGLGPLHILLEKLQLFGVSTSSIHWFKAYLTDRQQIGQVNGCLSNSRPPDHIAKKISSGLAGLKQVKPFVPTEVLISIFKALILPYFDYCDIVWAGLNKGLSERIDKLYNRAARIITQNNWETRSADILKMLQWDTLGVRRDQHTAIMMHKILHSRAPEYLTEEINLVRDGTAYSLRDSIYNLSLQKPRTEILTKRFSYRGAKLWNSLPNKMKSEESLESLRKRLFTLGLH